MFGHRLKIEADLWTRLARVAEKEGYASPEEFIVHLLERTAAQIEEAQGDEKLRQRLQGLGYLD